MTTKLKKKVFFKSTWISLLSVVRYTVELNAARTLFDFCLIVNILVSSHRKCTGKLVSSFGLLFLFKIEGSVKQIFPIPLLFLCICHIWFSLLITFFPQPFFFLYFILTIKIISIAKILILTENYMAVTAVKTRAFLRHVDNTSSVKYLFCKFRYKHMLRSS